MARIDISNFTFNKEEVTAINQLMYDDFIKAPALNETLTIFNNIVIDKEIGFIGEGGLVGLAGGGCGMPPQDYEIPTRRILWTPAQWKIYLEQCYTDLLGKFTVYSLQKGVKISDFSRSDYMGIVTNMLGESLRKFAFRLAWFSDKNAANVGAGGNITVGISTGYFTIIDGLWKQLMAQVTQAPAQRVTISENASNTYAGQSIPADKILTYLQSLVYNASPLLRAQTDAKIYCTQKFWDAYMMAIQTLQLENTYMNLLDGKPNLTFNGIQLVPIIMWDEMIRSYYDTGTSYFQPNRALYTTKNILGFGLDGEGSFGQVDLWFSQDDEKVKTRVAGMADAKILRSDLFMLAI